MIKSREIPRQFSQTLQSVGRSQDVSGRTSPAGVFSVFAIVSSAALHMISQRDFHSSVIWESEVSMER